MRNSQKASSPSGWLGKWETWKRRSRVSRGGRLRFKRRKSVKTTCIYYSSSVICSSFSRWSLSITLIGHSTLWLMEPSCLFGVTGRRGRSVFYARTCILSLDDVRISDGFLLQSTDRFLNLDCRKYYLVFFLGFNISCTLLSSLI